MPPSAVPRFSEIGPLPQYQHQRALKDLFSDSNMCQSMCEDAGADFCNAFHFKEDSSLCYFGKYENVVYESNQHMNLDMSLIKNRFAKQTEVI